MMLLNLYWILAITLMVILIIYSISMIIRDAKNESDFRKFKEKQFEMLNKLIEEREEK